MGEIYSEPAVYTGQGGEWHFLFSLNNGGMMYVPKSKMRRMDIEPMPGQRLTLRFKVSEGFVDPTCAGVELVGVGI